MGMTYELDDVEKDALVGKAQGSPLSQMKPRPGEKIQTFWCDGCECWHTASVIGGLVGDPHGEAK